MLNDADTTGNMYLARAIMPRPEVSLPFRKIQIEGKPWDRAVNLILHLSGKKPPELGVLNPPHVIVLEANGWWGEGWQSNLSTACDFCVKVQSDEENTRKQ